MYRLYPSYGGILSKIYWWLFRNCKMVRWLNRIDSSEVEFPFSKIAELEGKESLMAFNLGTPGPEQKISILGYTKEKERFFAKFSEKKDAIELTKNEIKVYRLLESTNLTPMLFDSREIEDYIWMKTSCVDGDHMSSMKLTKDVVDVAVRLSNFHLSQENDQSHGLRTSLSHGDFCPWNMLVKNGNIQLIDWEMAAERPLGYDVFKYIWQISQLFTPNKTFEEVIDENKKMLNYYFSSVNIKDWSEYLKYFVDINTMCKVLMS